MKIAFIGYGNMSKSIISGILNSKLALKSAVSTFIDGSRAGSGATAYKSIALVNSPRPVIVAPFEVTS